MSVEFTCGDPAALAGYLYDEYESPAERAAIEAHVAACARCAAEVAALRTTRDALASWTPPDAQLGFRITSDRDEKVLRPARWWQRPMPAWAQAAAAVLIFAAGAVLGMRTAEPPSVSTSVSSTVQPAAPPAAVAATVSPQDLAALEARLRAEIGATRGGRAAVTVRSSSDDEEVLQRVRALVEESEQRQERQLVLGLRQVMRDVGAQRMVDLRNIEFTLGQMEAATRPELQTQRSAIESLIRRTSLQRSPER
jgi:hypothetical protein